jgi:hypothetical protein
VIIKTNPNATVPVEAYVEGEFEKIEEKTNE